MLIRKCYLHGFCQRLERSVTAELSCSVEIGYGAEIEVCPDCILFQPERIEIGDKVPQRSKVLETASGKADRSLVKRYSVKQCCEFGNSDFPVTIDIEGKRLDTFGKSEGRTCICCSKIIGAAAV